MQETILDILFLSTIFFLLAFFIKETIIELIKLRKKEEE